MSVTFELDVDGVSLSDIQVKGHFVQCSSYYPDTDRRTPSRTDCVTRTTEVIGKY